MLHFYSTALALQEIPGEISLAVNFTGCPRHCDGCHSPHLWEDKGRDTSKLFDEIKKYEDYITCVLFMGGDWKMRDLTAVNLWTTIRFPRLKTALYTALEPDELGDDAFQFDYVKTGPYIKELGGLDSPTTNQKLWRIHSDGSIHQIPFRKKVI